jgi:hypothetical protein
MQHRLRQGNLLQATGCNINPRNGSKITSVSVWSRKLFSSHPEHILTLSYIGRILYFNYDDACLNMSDIDLSLETKGMESNHTGFSVFRTQLCINTAIVYVHRFYMFHSFNKFHRNPISSCALFLAAKVEEQPRKLEHVIRVAHMILYKDQRNLDINSEVSFSYLIILYSSII